jgi:hypothetical protein
MDVCLLWVLCVVRQRSLRRAGPSSRGVLPSVVCIKSVWSWSLEKWGGLGPQEAVELLEKKSACIKSKELSKLNSFMYRQSVRFCSTAHEYCFHKDTQLLATVRPQGITEPFGQDTKWLGDSHCGQTVAFPASGCDTSLWLGHWCNAVLWERSREPQ